MSSGRTGYQHRFRVGLAIFPWRSCAIALSSLCAVSLLAVVGRSQGYSFGLSPAQAQEAALITDEDITNYATATAAIETLRKTAYGEASDVLAAANSEVSLVDNRLSCLNSTVEDMPEVAAEDQVSLQRILVSYCNTASTLAEENGLTPQRFNAITAKHKEDRKLAQKIQAAMPDSEPASTETVE